LGLKALRIYMMMVALLGLTRSLLPGQYFVNPSFEGVPGLSVPPPSWQPLDVLSTPDTEPIGCDSYRASSGSTYMTLITRGPLHIKPNSTENAITRLQEPMEALHYYQLSIDLASRNDVGHFSWEDGFIPYNSPVKLSVFGSYSELAKGELLAESPVVSNHNWENYSLILFPQSTVNYLIVEAGVVESQGGTGNLAMDNIHIEERDEPPVEFGELRVPNVFTPDGDGVNDTFIIPGLASQSFLVVFDRSGTEVFRSHNYNHGWDGTDMDGKPVPDGTYWYILSPSDQEDGLKGFVYIKRE